jgi:large subunit ribosomal protein L4
MQVEILNISGKKTAKTADLADSIFAAEPNDHCIYLDVKLFLANQRQGTSKTLERSEVSGSTKKLHKQKGTGGSRKGSVKNPLFPV